MLHVHAAAKGSENAHDKGKPTVTSECDNVCGNLHGTSQQHSQCWKERSEIKYIAIYISILTVIYFNIH